MTRCSLSFSVECITGILSDSGNKSPTGNSSDPMIAATVKTTQGKQHNVARLMFYEVIFQKHWYRLIVPAGRFFGASVPFSTKTGRNQVCFFEGFTTYVTGGQFVLWYRVCY